MVTRLIGRKLGMTQIYTEKGRCYPVTVIQAGPCTVTQVKTVDNDGYNAVQISFGSKRASIVSRAELGHLVPRNEEKPADRKKQLDKALREMKVAPRVIREVPWDGKEEVKRGDTIDVSIFQDWKKVDVIGTSKGRGFMGAIRRWNFHRQPATRGCSDRERAPGSLIGGQEGGKAGHVVKGKKMPGHWGDERACARNLDVIQVNKERNLLFVHGAIPGANGGIVLVKESHWVAPRAPTVVSKKKPGGRR